MNSFFKTLFASTLVAGTLLAFTASADAPVPVRQAHQAARIHQGVASGEIDRRSAEEPVGTVVCGEQRTDFFFQSLVAGACLAKIGTALYRGNVERGLQQLVDVVPAVIVHWRSGRRALDTTRLSRSSIPASR